MDQIQSKGVADTMQPHPPAPAAPSYTLLAASREPDEAAGVCRALAPSSAAAHAELQLGFTGAASEQDASEQALTPYKHTPEVSLTQNEH